MKYDLFNKFIDYLRGREKQPDLEVGNEDEQEFADNIEMARKLDNSPIEPDPKFAKRLLNETKMELREQTARRVKFPIWHINFRFSWMAYASAVIIVLIFVMWGFGQLNNSGVEAPVQLAQDSPLLSSHITGEMLEEKSAPEVVLAENETIENFAPQLDIPQEQDEVDEPVEPDNEPTDGSLALEDMPDWPDEFGQELDDLTNLMDDLESFGAGLNVLDSDLDNF